MDLALIALEVHPIKRVYLNASKKVLYDQVKFEEGVYTM